MSMEITKADYLKAITDAQVIVLSKPENLAIMGEAMAQSVAQMFELLSPEAAAGLLGKAESTLLKRHKKMGLDKSVAFGRETPLFFLSQVIASSKAKVIRGRRDETEGTKVTHFPETRRKAG